MNIQSGNVGNLGDVLKHAGLVQLSLALKEIAAGQNTVYVETHSFLLQTRIPDAVAWTDTVNSVAQGNSGYAAYVEAESNAISNGTYRCSAGLVLETLKPCAGFLAEIDAQTRRELERQLINEGHSATTSVVENADQLTAALAGKSERCSGFLMLVDPFIRADEVWPSVQSITKAVYHDSLSGAVEVFAYGKEPVDWPPAPRGFPGPIATISRPPFHLATYATDRFQAAVVTALRRLGWKVHGIMR